MQQVGISKLDELAINTIRTLAMDGVQKAKSGHPGTPMGVATMAYTLWTEFMRYNPRDPQWPNRDRFVLSAGHASMLLYSLLYLTGYDLELEDLKNFRQWGSKTPGHPEYGLTPGVETTTGPLGQGVGNAVGMALAEHYLAARYNKDKEDLYVVDWYVYGICSDGDLMEGVASEAASLAGELGLGRLILMYDDNHITIEGDTQLAFTEDVGKRFEAYKWHVQHIDGNDKDQVAAALEAARNQVDAPSMIVCRTEIGYGSPHKANTAEAHGNPLGDSEVQLTKENLGWPKPDETFYVPQEALDHFRQATERGAQEQAAWQARYDKWAAKYPDLADEFQRMTRGELPQGWVERLPSFKPEDGPLATRSAQGKVLNSIAAQLPLLVGGSADLDPSTKTYLKDQGDFQPDNFAGRNIHYGVREHAMAAINNGLALHGGLLPFGATFLNFLDYMKGAVRLACINKVRCYYVLTHDSVFLGEDGPTHQPIEHLAHMRATPNLMLVRPADALETLEAWKVMVNAKDGPWALVLSRQKLPYLGDREAAVSKGAYILTDTDGTSDLIFIASGSEVSLAMQAATLLQQRGMHARVVSMPCWELFEAQPQEYRDRVLPPDVTARMSIEAASTFGWERWTGSRGYCYGIDHFGTSAPAGAIAKEYGFTPEHIAQIAQEHFATVRR